MDDNESYRTRPIKRQRRTKDDIDLIKQGIIEVLSETSSMTVRQVFYQLTSRGYVPKTEAAYKGTVCRLLTDMRLSGIIPFGQISDNTRWMRKPRTFDNVEQALIHNLKTYRRALWNNQPVYVEVWIEKDALAGVLIDITEQWDVPLMVTRGYPSLTYLYEAAETLEQLDKPSYIYYMGDYDPSGLDIARTTESRLREFAPNAELHFERIAVTEYQIENWNLPSRPTKTTDTRYQSFGSAESVELDAIHPDMLRNLVDKVITKHIDADIYLGTLKVEQMERESLEKLIYRR